MGSRKSHRTLRVAVHSTSWGQPAITPVSVDVLWSSISQRLVGIHILHCQTHLRSHRTPSIKTRTSSTALSQSSKFYCDDRITADQNEYFPSPETTLHDCYYYTPALRLPPLKPSLVVSPRRPLPPTPKTPITSFTDQSSEAKDNAEEIQSLKLIPKKPSLGVVSPPRRLLSLKHQLLLSQINQVETKIIH